jgi:hypothetical protein
MDSTLINSTGKGNKFNVLYKDQSEQRYRCGKSTKQVQEITEDSSLVKQATWRIWTGGRKVSWGKSTESFYASLRAAY